MSFNPGVTFFVPFYQLDPSSDRRCIFYTLKGARCRCFRNASDVTRAIEVHRAINAISGDAMDLALLQEYILCTCCRRAKHRDRMEDVGLLIPLAQRWQDEIRTHTSIPMAFGESIVGQNARLVLATSSHGGLGTLESRTRYNLRPRETADCTAIQINLISRSPQSEFRPHVVTPGPCDSVSWKILAPLKSRDFEPGSIYVFSRASSPGHVKIGWTAGSVSHRLASWSKCGYIPNLRFSVGHIPHARRIETLTHHELINEWRRERMCQAAHCRKSHQEWFETTPEKAARVVGFWADFMEKAQPYESNGWLKIQWRSVVLMLAKNKECITGERLVDYHTKSVVKEMMVLVEALTMQMRWNTKQKLESAAEEIRIKAEQDLEESNILAISAVPENALLVEDTPVPKGEPLHGKPALLEEPLPNSGLQAKDETTNGESSRTIIVKEEEIAPERAPLPPPPTLHPNTSYKNLPHSQDQGPIPNSGKEATSAIDINPIALANVTVNDSSLDHKSISLLLSSAPAPPSSHPTAILNDRSFGPKYEIEC